ncbi:hypothetical protein K1719_039910 [Acacia pycnantha]|nr:hypothetical protein K1719_039910 [Acacia pycnantha]
MEKAGGRPRDEVWQHVKVLEGGRRVKCNYCGYEFAASANRIKSHINKDKGKGIRVCPNFLPQSHNFASDNKGNSDHLKDNLLHSQGFSLDGLIDHGKSHEVGQIQGGAKYEERLQVGSSSVSNRENGYLQVLQYVFECLSPTDKVYDSGRLNLNQKDFFTLKPRAFLDSSVIDVFVEILTESEKNKATPSNWYLPVMFSTAALVCDEHNFKDFVHGHKMREDYIFDQESPEKVFIPVHVEQGTGHFYLYIFHLNKKVVEIWDSAPTFLAETARDETTKKLLIAMGILFEKVTFTEFHRKMADDILLQRNGFDCGVFVINYMQQSDNYVKRDSSFLLDSQKEREDLAFKLLNNGLNKEKQNLYDKARRHYAQDEEQHGSKRLRVDPSKEHFEDVGGEMEVEYDDLEKGPPQSTSFKDQLIHSDRGQIEGDSKYQERIQVGSSSVSNWDTEDFQMIQYVFECLSPGVYVFQSPCFHLTQNEFITLKPGTWLNSPVIDTFVEILTESEKNKATPSNCYLPAMFSKEALKYVEHNFKQFVQKHKIRENYLFHIKSPEKVFIPVRIEQETQGHFYLYIFHLNKKVVEIWDSLPTFVAETVRDETTKKLFFAMEILFNQEKGAFSDYQKEMANDICFQDNGFDCGVFVINYMQQSDNYVKRDSSFQFDSKKEREDLALKLLTNDLNQEKQNLYDKARGRLYAQVEKHDCNERLRVDASETYIEAKYDDRVNRHDGLQKGSSKGYLLPTTDLIGKGFQRYTEKIWRWIMDDKVSAIGVWGTGGSGKTTLATHIHNKLILEEAGSDIRVIWVTVSQKNSISHLQKVIARSIELDISDEFEVKRIAGKLLQAFKVMKKCVVILDDVWDHFFLKEIGFPMSDNQVKLILTTRILEVCEGMGCKNNIVKVESLNDVDSWALFEKIMGFHEELSWAVEEIARNISNECEGLPLAIVRIATSMKGKKHVREWSHMLECLQNLSNVGNGQYEMDKWVLPVLRSSYDFLTNKMQRFFLYYALNTSNGCVTRDGKNRLIRRFVFESMDETKKFRVLYNEGYKMFDKLQNHGMLNEYSMGLGVWGMNKFLRALAINIAEDTGKIMANDYKVLKEIPSDDQWEDDLQKVFLTGNVIQTIPNGTCPRCSLLSALFLDGNKHLNYISDDFFNNMLGLKTLDLSETRIKCLPESVSNLKCLNALLLSECEELSYIPPLINLKRLIVLDLSWTAITEAPLGLESLIKLRFLNLLRMPNLVISGLVISKLINLEHLELDVTTQVPIQCLQNLEVIVANFRDSSVFNTYTSFLAKHCVLRSYHITLEGSRYGGINKEYSKRISFTNMNLTNISPAILPINTNEFFIYGCHKDTGSLCNALSYCRGIERLDIRNTNVKSLCCLSSRCPFCSSSQLVECLELFKLMDLKDIVSPDALPSSHQPSLFSHLTHLKIYTCDNMETLMTPKLLVLLQNLRSIDVTDCGKMKEIVGEDDHSKMELGGSGDLSHPTPPIIFPKLTSLKLYELPQLRNLVYRGVMRCPSLQTFVVFDCDELNSPRIEISKGCELPMKNTCYGYCWGIETD